jgi:hypothetical protein
VVRDHLGDNAGTFILLTGGIHDRDVDVMIRGDVGDILPAINAFSPLLTSNKNEALECDFGSLAEGLERLAIGGRPWFARELMAVGAAERDAGILLDLCLEIGQLRYCDGFSGTGSAKIVFGVVLKSFRATATSKRATRRIDGSRTRIGRELGVRTGLAEGSSFWRGFHRSGRCGGAPATARGSVLHQ